MTQIIKRAWIPSALAITLGIRWGCRGRCRLDCSDDGLRCNRCLGDRCLGDGRHGDRCLGDVRHGDGRVNRHYRERWSLHRLALHASNLSFDHPINGARVSVDAPLPDDLGVPFAALGFEPQAGPGSSRIYGLPAFADWDGAGEDRVLLVRAAAR